MATGYQQIGSILSIIAVASRTVPLNAVIIAILSVSAIGQEMNIIPCDESFAEQILSIFNDAIATSTAAA